MRPFFFVLICLGFLHCFAEQDSMGYFYQNRCENASRPDIAALAVLEKQSCPSGTESKYTYSYDDGPIWSHDGEVPTCTSQYRIISILDAVSDTLRKKYLNAENYPIIPRFMHRPILIFGKYKNGKLRIEEYEETRGYFFPFDIADIQPQGYDELYPLVDIFMSDIYALHAIGTTYYPRIFDTGDSLYYRYLIHNIKRYVENAGKDFNKFRQLLTQKRTPVKTTKIKNGFAALGHIKNVNPIRTTQQTQFYELSLGVETVFKNDANIDTSITIYIDKKRLPPVWGCHLKSTSWFQTSFYFFGDIKNGRLIIESLGSTRDMFVFGDTIYDITMGLPFRELLTYFLPSNISLEEFEFGNSRQNWLYFIRIKDGKIPEDMADMSECSRKDIIEIAEKWVNFFDNKRGSINNYNPIMFSYDTYRQPSSVSNFNNFRCRRSLDYHVPPFTYESFEQIVQEKKTADEKSCNKCRRHRNWRSGQWGRKLSIMKSIE